MARFNCFYFQIRALPRLRAALAAIPLVLLWLVATGTEPAHAAPKAEQAPAVAAGSPAPAGQNLNFVNDIVPVLTKYGCNSGGCHGRGSGQNGFKLSLFGFDPPADYSALVDEGDGRRISWTAPDESLMLLKPTGKVPHGGGVRFDADSAAYRQLRLWIAAGTPWGDDRAPQLASIAVEPAEKILAPGESLQLKVVARYSDGSTRDASALAEYFSLRPANLSVSFEGLVRSLGERGDAAVMVRYLGIVAVSRMTVPYADKPPDVSAAAFQPKNYIDGLVLEKWRKLGLAPSPQATDAVFLRRAYLDAIGTLPTPKETRDFLADASPDKRDRLIDRLLERPEYAIYWSQQWGDILRNKQVDGSHKADSRKFEDWLRDAFAKNMPFDKFARELIAVSGKIENHPQMDWYRQLNTTQNRVEDTAQVFLGLRVACAHCHNHPFERISQNDYWQFAAYFAKVDAMGYGPVKTVGLKDDGSVTNPRTGKTTTPKPFGGADCAFVKGQDPRQKLVDWMVAKENPYFARAIANRIWAHYMNRGLVEAVDDLRATNPPTNPALLDALADDLRRHGFDLKLLMKNVMKSAVYGLSPEPTPANAMDKENYARHYPVRLSPQVLMDAIDTATGVPTKFREFPDVKRAIQLPTEAEPNDFLDIFGRSRRDTPCVCETHLKPNLSQVLYMMFAPELESAIASPQGTVARLLKEQKSSAEIVGDLYLLTVCRPPSADELHDAVALVDGAKQKQPVVEDLLWTLLNSKEFLFDH
ncbi:MAG TPA: DUF1549 domain-containing protein [Pirellulales bacterium]|nr:DUF1549 domain-containing protein [Pirellulales bacterium]